MNLKDKNGQVIPHGSIIRWNVEDYDDNTTWQFTGIVVDHALLNYPFHDTKQHVIYLGGGIDSGGAIGKKIPFNNVIKQSENNDPDMVGIDVIGTASDMAKWIGVFGK